MTAAMANAVDRLGMLDAVVVNAEASHGKTVAALNGNYGSRQKQCRFCPIAPPSTR